MEAVPWLVRMGFADPAGVIAHQTLHCVASCQYNLIRKMEFIVMEKASEFASVAGGQIAIQTLLSLLVNLYIGECEDHDLARNEITKMAEDMVEKAFVPDLPVADQKAARDQAKKLVRALIVGHQAN
jgi:hypothetical protein